MVMLFTIQIVSSNFLKESKMNTLFRGLTIGGFLALGGCGGATLGAACENSVNLCFGDLVDDVDAAVADCVDAGADDDTMDADTIKCVANATTCDAIMECAPASDAGDDDDDDDDDDAGDDDDAAE